MTDITELVKILLSLSGTFAALCIPAVSVAYFIVANVREEEQRRMASVIILGALAGIIFVIATIGSLVLIVLDSCGHWWVVGLFFSVGCVLVIVIFITLAGVRMSIKIPRFRTKNPSRQHPFLGPRIAQMEKESE